MPDRIQVLISPEKKKAFKMACLQNDTSMSDYLIAKINEYLAANTKKQVPK